MSPPKIKKLTPEQEALIPVYRKKWRQIALSTQPLNRQKAREAIEAAYALIGEAEPEIIFYDSPKSVLTTIILCKLQLQFDDLLVALLRDSPKSHWFDKVCCYLYELKINPIRKQLRIQFTNKLYKVLVGSFLAEIKLPLERQLLKQMIEEKPPNSPTELDLGMISRDRDGVWDCIEDGMIAPLRQHLENQLEREVFNQLFEELEQKTLLGEKLKRKLDWYLGRAFIEQKESMMINDIKKQYLKSTGGSLHLNSWVVAASWMDYAISVLNLIHNPEQWNVYQSLVSHCGWVFPYEGICLVCSRPTKLSFDSDYRLHAEGKPAIEFADGYRLYYHHGVRLPRRP